MMIHRRPGLDLGLSVFAYFCVVLCIPDQVWNDREKKITTISLLWLQKSLRTALDLLADLLEKH